MKVPIWASENDEAGGNKQTNYNSEAVLNVVGDNERMQKEKFNTKLAIEWQRIRLNNYSSDFEKQQSHRKDKPHIWVWPINELKHDQ